MESDWVVLFAFAVFMAGLGVVAYDAISHDRKSTSRKQAKPAPDSRD